MQHAKTNFNACMFVSQVMRCVGRRGEKRVECIRDTHHAANCVCMALYNPMRILPIVVANGTCAQRVEGERRGKQYAYTQALISFFLGFYFCHEVPTHNLT